MIGSVSLIKTVKIKPRLLFLAFSFPPMHAVASVRAANIAKHLSIVGWEVSVVTPDPALLQSPDDLEKVTKDIQFWGIRMIYTGHGWRCLSTGILKRSYRHGVRWFLEGIPRWFARKLHVDEMSGWYPEAKRACDILKPGDIDVILATGSPFGSFKLAQQLGRRLRCPYVLDYRDPWTGNPHITFSSNREQRIERHLLEHCNAVSVVSPTWALQLGDRFGVAAKTYVIPNGYDPSVFENIEQLSFDHFAIVYTGIFIPPKRNIGPLMQVLSRLKELILLAPWKFHYFGPHGDIVRQSAIAHDVLEQIVLHGNTPRHQCLASVRGAGLAVVITSIEDTNDVSERGIIPGKIFEPIGLGTPVMVIAPKSSDVERLIETTGGGSVFSGSDIDGMAAFIADLIRGKKPEIRRPNVYAWPNLIHKFDVMLRQAQNKSNLNGTI